ncbi:MULTISPECIES: group-specific protein [Bacillaceae]|uniref:Group-specific protein n=1 Tax=Bacillus mesophilum TaxID=1071718 RepID=A0A7V7RRV0_9BACI|nr:MULTISPECIES: group-specific protein [Bacillaceae]KAB2335707.1 group-specific protein [Bacillus mesophilum]
MSECNVDHSVEDVKGKLHQQKQHLPEGMTERLLQFMEQDHTQEILNEIFHLLKKYDLADEKEKTARNKRFQILLANL